MDVNSDLEAEKVAQQLAQAQERVHAINEAWERCWEERKRLEEEEEAQQIAAVEAVTREAEEVLEREQQLQLQVSISFLQILTCINLLNRKIWRHQCARTIAFPFYRQGQRGELPDFSVFVLELKTRTEGATWDQWGVVLRPVQMAPVILHLAA